jgi:hypothetical protein
LLAKPADGLREPRPLNLHNQRDGIPAEVAGPTLPPAFGGINLEGRIAVVMPRTTPQQLAARFLVGRAK